MKRLREYKVDFLMMAGFLLLPLLLFGGVTLGGRTMLPADVLFQWAPWETAADEYGAEIPQNSLVTDLIVENYAWKRFVLNSLRNKEIPLWNPNLFAGAPFLATGQHSAYYPFSALFLVLPLAKAYGWYTVSQLWLAGALMYVFGRILKMGRAAAALAGLVYQGAGFMVVGAAVFPMVIGAAAWLPLLLACIEKVVGDWRLEIGDSRSTLHTPRSTLLWVALGAVALGMQILAGHIEITYYTLLIMAVYALWRLITVHVSSVKSHGKAYMTLDTWHLTPLRPVGWLLSMVALGLMLGAVQLVPLYEVGQVNFREGSASFAEVKGYAFPARRILTLALPNFFGNPAHHTYVDALSGNTVPFAANYYGELNPHGAYTSSWGIKNYVEGGIYLGILPLFLAGLGAFSIFRSPAARAERSRSVNGQQSIVNGRRSHTAFFITLSFFSLAFIFGTPLYALLYYGLPFVNQLHTPFRWVFPLSLCVAALAGLGGDFLAATRSEERGAKSEERKSLILRLRSGQVSNPSTRLRTSLLSPFFLRGRPSLITALAGASFWGGVLLLLGLLVSRPLYDNIAPFIERLFLGLAQAADAFPDARAFYSYEWRQLFLLGLMLAATGAVLRVSRCPIFVGSSHGRRPATIHEKIRVHPRSSVSYFLRKRPLWEFMAAVVIIVDVLAANYGFNAAVDPALLDYKPEMVSWLEAQPGHWRLTSFTPHGDKPFNANAGWLFDLQDIRGYDSIIPKQYTDYMGAIEPQNELPFNRVQPIVNWESLNSPLLDVLGVKYIITAETLDLPKLQLAWEGEGVRIYENLAVAPRAYTLPLASTAVVADALAAMTELDPRGYVVVERGAWSENLQSFDYAQDKPPIPNPYQPAAIDSYGNIEVIASAAVDESAWLILNDSYFPGWKAFVRPFGGAEEDETETNIIRVNGNFRGVLLEPGHWTVRFRYSPATFQLGGLASAMGGVILLFAVGVWGWRRVVRADAEMTTTRSLAKNSVAPMTLNLFNRGIDFLFAAFYLRFLGPVQAGSYAYAIAAAGFFDIIANFGLNILLIRDVSQDKEQASRYLLNSTILRLGTGFVGAIPILLYVWATSLGSNPPTGAETAAITLIMVGMLFSSMSLGVTGLFYVYEKAEIPAAMTTVTTILKVGLGVMALLLGYGFVGLAAVSILVNIITLAVLTLLAFRNFTLPGPWRVDFRLQRQMIGKGYPLMLIHLLQTVFISIDVVILRNLLSNGREVVGWYNSAYKWFNALQIVPSFFTLALFPVISRESQRSLDAARRMYRLSLKLMLLLALPTAVLTTFWAYPLVHIVGGSEYLPHGAIALQIVIWAIPLGWLNSVTNYVLIALGLERMQPRAFIVAVAFNVIANLLFIPAYSYVAASVTTVLSELVLMALFAYYLRQKMTAVNWRGLMARPSLAAAVMVIATLLGNQLHPLAGLALGLAAYPAALWALRVLGEEERHVLRSILPVRVAARLRLL